MATIELFTSPTCPYCPPAKKALSEAAEALKAEGLEVEYVNYDTRSPEGLRKAREYDIMSVPAAIVCGSRHKFLLDAFNLPTVREACLVADGRKDMPGRKGFW
ncbi:MAG: thioredoxin family protein [Candidatus Micrarchaeota archaeon]